MLAVQERCSCRHLLCKPRFLTLPHPRGHKAGDLLPEYASLLESIAAAVASPALVLRLALVLRPLTCTVLQAQNRAGRDGAPETVLQIGLHSLGSPRW